MRYLTIILFSIIFSQTAQSQIYEIGVFGGGSNFIGDVGKTNYISPNQSAFGAILKWNRSPRHSWRVSVIYAGLEGIDAKSDDPRRQERDYSFDNNIFEISAGMEFTFFDFNLHEYDNKTTPYLYTGITSGRHSNFYFDNNGEIVGEGTYSWAFGIPMVLGVKTTLTDHLILGAEIGARYTFSDELDGSVPDFDNEHPISFGNTNSNDWYVFTGFTLTYTFGRRPCYCDF